jgi:hypothetical protein
MVVPSAFDPVPLLDPKIAGFRFPESAETVARWAASDDVDAAARHAWGLWTALMTDSGESFEGQPLRVFETWFTTRDLLASVPLPTDPGWRIPHPLGDLEQLHRDRRLARLDAGTEVTPPNADSGNGDAGSPAGDELLGFVKFDPVAAEHIARNRLLSKGRLQELLTLPVAKIPEFPSSAIVVKAVYQTLSTGGDAGTSAAQYSKLASWTGPPDPAAPFPPSSWTDCVWIDRLDPTSGTGTGEVDTRCAGDGSSRTPATTYGLGRFVHFTLSATEAAAAHVPSSATVATSPPETGDIALLIAMHITTRESPEWTWETYWWTPTPDKPAAPSSAAFAAARPGQLSSAARNYAGCTALSMLRPPPPSTGGSNVGESVYCFNPWLEAKFGPKDLPDSQAVTSDGVSATNDVGVQSNCMSCHAQANYSPQVSNGKGSRGPDYTGDRYVDRSSAEFNGTLLTDFLWSIPDSATDP